MPRGRWLTLALVIGVSACRGSILRAASQVLIFGSPDDPAAVQQTDAGVSIDFGTLVVATTKTLTLQYASVGTEGTLGPLTAIAPDPEFDVPFVTGAPVGPALNSITVSFTPTTLGAKSAVLQLTVYVATTQTVTIQLSGTSVTNGLTVSPTPANFGNVEVGQAFSEDLTITNTSAVPVDLEVSGLEALEEALDAGEPDGGTADGGGALDGGGGSSPPRDGGLPFALGVPDVTTLGPGASTTIQATFSPQQTGQVSASFSLNGFRANPFVLTGNGLASCLEATSPLHYGFVQVGQTLTRSIVIQNHCDHQTPNLTSFPQFSSVEEDVSAFLLPYPAPQFPQAVEPAGAIGFPLFFEPTDFAYAAEDAFFFTDDPAAPVLDVKLDGWGGGPHVECQSPLVFGPVAVGYGVTLPVTCVNAGTAIPDHPQFTLQLTQSQLTADNPDFTALLVLPDGGSVGPDAGVSLAAGQKTDIQVTYRPSDAGVVNAELHVLSNNTNDADAGVLLEGEGVVPGVCSLGFTPTALAFNEVPQGTKGVLQFGIENLGQDYCILTDVHQDAASDPAFSVISPNPAYILLSFAGNTDNPRSLPTVARADVQFAPSEVEALASGSVDVTVKNAVPSTQTVAVTGECKAACLSVAPAGWDFGVVGLSPSFNRICRPDSQTFAVTNSCPGQVTIQDLVLNSRLDTSSPQFDLLKAPAVPITLDGGDEVDFQASFVPTTTGDTVESIDLTSSEYPATPYLISLRGDAEYGGTQTDIFIAQVRKIDLAWLIDEDDSYPMVQNVRALIPDLFASLDEAQVDYQMAFTTTETCTGTHSDQGWFEPCDHCLSTASSNPFFLVPSTPDPTTTMSGILDTYDVPPELHHCQPINGGKHFFDSIALTFAPSLLTGHNSGFIRPDAYLAIVVVNGDDEDDGADAVHGYGADYLTSELRAQNLVRSLKPKASMVSVSYVGEDIDLIAAPNEQISKLVKNTGGVEVNVNQEVGKLAFLDLLADVAELGVYHLTTAAIYTGPFDVTVDGLPVTGWTYNRTANTIVFAPGSIPPPGSVVTVTYPFGCF